ncbi:MAG: alanine:cation symporter family protein [Deltaproteobacteria bacterium]|nr:alanine:cation symporter family protein [Deltaproteobacteria bacterium]
MTGIDAAVNAWVRPVADALASVVFFSVPIAGVDVPLVVAWLVVGAVFFTLRFRFVNLRGLREAFRLVRTPTAPGSAPGEVSHFQALATAVSGTVGIGNIGGVAIAVSLGGPGAAFWMILAGFLGMSTKFVECTLGVMYRRENPDGSVSGGPMYYLERGFAERGLAKLGRGLGIFYAIGIVIGCMGIGNMFQSNQAFVQVVGVTGGEGGWLADKGWLVGAIIAVAVGTVIVGGIRSIARVTAKLVPFMAVLYLSAALVVLVMNAEALPWAFGAMLDGAFTSQGIAGGSLGAMVIGFQRAVFSNEAGIGSATIAHSAVRTSEPLTEGFVSLLEPLLDTIVICQATALVVITTEYFEPGFTSGLGGIEMTSAAFERNLSWAPIPLAFAAALFAFSTMISWSYYGLKGWTYLVGEGRRGALGFNLAFCAFAALGCVVQLEAILEFSDALVFLICVPNLIGLYVLAPVVAKRLRSYEPIGSGGSGGSEGSGGEAAP